MGKTSRKEKILYILGGILNTLATYLIYLWLNVYWGYQISFSIAFFVGVIFSYWFNAYIVFSVPLRWKTFFSYPVVYITQYLLAGVSMFICVDFLNINELFAPLFVALVLTPITYLMSKVILGQKKH